VSEQVYHEGDSEFAGQVTKAGSANPAGIFVAGYYPEAALISLQVRGLGMTSVLLGPDGWDSPRLVGIAGHAIEGAYYLNHFSADDPGSKRSVTSTGAGSESPRMCLRLLLRCRSLLIELSGRPTCHAHGNPRCDGAHARLCGGYGENHADRNRDPIKSAVVLQIRNGKPAFCVRSTRRVIAIPSPTG